MASEEEKGKIEISIFKRFAEAAGLDYESVEKQSPEKGKPDLKCIINGEVVFFELTEACSEDIAKAIANVRNPDDPAYIRVRDYTAETYQKKINKRYSVEQPVELLIYNIGRTLHPDNVLIETLRDLIQKQKKGQFRKVWYFGENVSEL